MRDVMTYNIICTMLTVRSIEILAEAVYLSYYRTPSQCNSLSQLWLSVDVFTTMTYFLPMMLCHKSSKINSIIRIITDIDLAMTILGTLSLFTDGSTCKDPKNIFVMIIIALDYILFGTVCILEYRRHKNKITTLLPIREP